MNVSNVMVFRRPDGVEHGGEDLVAVEQGGGRVPADQRRPEQVAQRLGELRVVHGVLRVDLVMHRPFGHAAGLGTEERAEGRDENESVCSRHKGKCGHGS